MWCGESAFVVMSTNLLLRIRPRLRRAFKFCRHNTELCFRRCPLSRACHLTVTKSPLGLFKEISPKRNFFQGDPPARVRPLCAFGANSPTPALADAKGFFALCGARPKALPLESASLREGLTQALFLGAHQNLMST